MSREGFNRPKPIEDFYAKLGVSRDATEGQIKDAFRTLAAKFHPEVQGGGDEKRFKEISEAYAELKTPEKRAAYDATLPPLASSKDLNEQLQDALDALLRRTNERNNPSKKGTFIVNGFMGSHIEKDGVQISKVYPDIIAWKNKHIIAKSDSGLCLLDPVTGKRKTPWYKKMTHDGKGNLMGVDAQGKSTLLT